MSLVILGVLLFLIDERENLYNVFKEAIEIFRSLGLEGAERVTIKIIDTLTRS